MSTVSSSSCLRAGTPWSEEWHWFLAPIYGTDISDTLGMEDTGASPPSAAACHWVVADIPRRVASGTSLVRSCRGYRSAPWFSGKQAHMAAPKASMKAW